MNASKVSRALVIASLVCFTISPATAAPPQIRTAPRPVIQQNPNAPRLPAHHPDPQGSAPPPAEQFSGVEFDIHTGADDLRNNSNAYAMLNFADSSNQKCELKVMNADSWNNDSDHIVQCHLDKTRSYDDLRSARILIVKENYTAALVWDPDNWNVDRIKVVAKDPANHTDKCVWQANGNPLIRLTGNSPKFAVEDYDTTC